ncbi:Methyltransferase domain-containing protein [Oceanobacillus limi]|uniref:Methyltransferase domain-containing protein n=1 Tax=Oceanobacillus limi TaxID=930131 RepID=A0A1I0FUL9_9BACI|nr:class I SAM-dependent methyltransferase [Oceanobacillus limi]SET61952.1 Methyltransferase domain-containing protein [Oceanobacillus limi]
MSYQQMALLYDKLMEDAPYDAWVTFTESILQQFGIKDAHIADLGCGTGEITYRLASKGYHMVGVDYSADMLAIAEQKVSKLNLPIHWLNQDLKDLHGLDQMDAAISYCDVMNYITETDELEAVFHHVANSLKPGGLFIFDVHSLHHVQDNLINQTFADVTEEASYIWDCSEGDYPGEMYHDITFFMLDEGNKYTRFDETHHQRTYSVSIYEQLLKKSGFININFYSDFSLENQYLEEKVERIFIIGEKGSR